jgi:hypothetical protein
MTMNTAIDHARKRETTYVKPDEEEVFNPLMNWKGA